ncbi:MAG: hypothetical protein ACRD32_02695, partial [Nitrososphaerales archaeon]
MSSGQNRGFGVSQNTDAKQVLATKISGEASVEVVPTITLGVLPTILKWGAQATASGQVTGFISSDSVTIIWGDGTSSTGIPISPTGGWSATHTYLSSAVGNNVVKAQLKNGGSVIAESTTVSVTVQKHDTELSGLSATSVKWGLPTTLSAILKDKDAALAPIPGQTLSFGGAGLASPPASSGPTSAAGVGTAAGVTTSAGAGTKAITAGYAGSTAYNAATSISGNIILTAHAVSLTLGVNGPLTEATDVVVSGKVTDNDLPSNSVNGVEVDIDNNGGINFADPVTAGIRVTDGGAGLSVAGGVLTVNPTTVFDTPFAPTDVRFSFSGISTAGDIVMDVTYIDPANSAATITSSLIASVPAGNPIRGVSFGSGIVSVEFLSFPGSTLGFSNIQTQNQGNLVQDVGFGGLSFSGAVVTVGGGTYASSGTLGLPPSVQITAQTLPHVDYLVSGLATLDVPITGDTGGGGTGGNSDGTTTFNGKVFSPYNCGDTTGTYADNSDASGDADNDDDFLCDRWETLGIPFTINNYASGGTPRTESLSLGTTTNPSPLANKDIWVEEDYFVGPGTTPAFTHRLRDDAVSGVTTAFLNRGIYLHVIPDDAIAEATATNVWTDTDTTYGNDFNTIKGKYFGLPSERATVSFATGTDATIAAPTACTTTTSGQVTVAITGIQISTVANAFGNDVSGKVAIQFKLNKPNTSTLTVSSISATGSGTGLSVGSMTAAANSRIDSTTSSLIKTITILVPFSVTDVVTNALLGTVSVTFTEGTCGTTTVTTVSGAVGALTSMQEAKAKAYHYLLSIHSIGTCVSAGTPSGRSEGVGNDMVVALGCGTAWAVDSSGHTVGNKNQQAGTLMHEIGHNLGLNHGG